jgi:LemA protein
MAGHSVDTSTLVIGAIVVVIVLWVIVIYNRLVAGKNQAQNAWKQIDVQLKRRHDLIPNLVETTKGYMQYEQETLTKVVEARSRAVSAATPKEAIAAENALSGALGRLFALAENYPQLKSNENASRLMEELSATENKIGFARQFYNDSVMSQTNLIQSFPSSVIAGLFRFETPVYFEAPPEEREVPKVNLR